MPKGRGAYKCVAFIGICKIQEIPPICQGVNVAKTKAINPKIHATPDLLCHAPVAKRTQDVTCLSAWTGALPF